ncbi:sulfotransferase family protein [Virgibacillus sp. L01]|uniref:sulfotransferase family protein n=1 Tax=Virgibacillus sp. L01 TaxID=3457429 RepID=UPI003FD09E0F
MNQEPIFVLGAHKSGTSLLRNLFDGHKQLFVIPLEAHFFQHNGMWIDYGIRRQYPKKFKEKEIIENYINWVGYANKNADLYADSNTKGFWNIHGLKEELLNRNDYGNLKSSIENYVESMFYSLFNEKLSNGTRIVEKSVENAEFASTLKKIFPKAKFIHIVRNPYSNLVSIRKFKAKKGYPNLKQIMQSLYNNYYYLERNKVLLDNDYFIVKYEDLVKEPIKTVDTIRQFTGLNHDDILYEPTVNGDNWSGNSTTNTTFQGVSDKYLDKWKNEIEPIEIRMVNQFFASILEEYNYKKIKDQGILKFSKKEKFKQYILNRLLLKYL